MGWKMAGVALIKLMFGNFIDLRGFSFEWVCNSNVIDTFMTVYEYI